MLCRMASGMRKCDIMRKLTPVLIPRPMCSFETLSTVSLCQPQSMQPCTLPVPQMMHAPTVRIRKKPAPTTSLQFVLPLATSVCVCAWACLCMQMQHECVCKSASVCLVLQTEVCVSLNDSGLSGLLISHKLVLRITFCGSSL